jgi:hypothetical protein
MPCFFLDVLQAVRELLAVFIRFVEQICLVQRARLEHPADCILPDAKNMAGSRLEFLGFARQNQLSRRYRGDDTSEPPRTSRARPEYHADV